MNFASLRLPLLILAFAVAGSCMAAAQGTYLYSAGYASDFVSGYSINATSGGLTPVAGSPYALPAGSSPGSIVTDSQCRHAYAGNWAGTLAAYSINPSDGSLTPLANSPLPSGTQSAFVAVDAADTHVFVANYGDSTISVFNQSNGVLTPAVGSPFPAVGANPDFLVVDATGKYLYSANQSSDSITAFTIGSSGSLTPIGSPYAVPPGSSPRGLTIDPANKYLYVSNTVGSTMSVFSIDSSTGALTEIPGSPFPTPFNIYQLAIHPSGTFGWLGTDSGAMYNVSIDPSTGAIQVLNGVYTGANPPTIAFEPTGQWFYTNNQGSSAVLNQWHVDSSASASFVASFPAGVNATYSAICTTSAGKNSVIQSNFNGTPINAGSTVWFNSVLKASGLGTKPVTIYVRNAKVTFAANGTSYNVAVPNATVTFSPTATTASTVYDSGTNTWHTTVPSSLGGNMFLAGAALPVTANLPGGINPVAWSGNFSSDTPGVTVNWQWAAAVYSNFGTDYNALAVKPVDSNSASAYQNSDHAGTPENYKPSLIPGARGGGGSNYTGGYSGTGSVKF